MEERKNNLLPILLTIFIVITLVLGGYVIYDKFTSNSKEKEKTENKQENKQNEKEEQTVKNIKIDQGKDYIYEKEIKKFEVNDVTLNVKLPFINIDSVEVSNINNKLNELFNDAVRDNSLSFNKYTEKNGFSWNFKELNYEYYLSNDLISLVIEEQPVLIPSGGNSPIITVYNINKTDGSLVNRESLLKKFKLTEETYLVIANKFLENYKYDYPEITVQEKSIMDKTIKDNNYLENAKLFVNNDNKLEAIVSNVPTLSGHSKKVNFIVE